MVSIQQEETKIEFLVALLRKSVKNGKLMEPGRPLESLDEDRVDDVETMPRRNPPNPSASRQRFGKFHTEDAAGPRDVLRCLQDLAGQWLRPDIHTKEQTVETLEEEPFQAVLPEELRARAQRCQLGVRITG
uniref:SCAN box domain-containing protein n=1 Tax=Rhinolophus ferrumequinum TaxID=59479 RepID=A0A671DN77_RHIFE